MIDLLFTGLNNKAKNLTPFAKQTLMVGVLSIGVIICPGNKINATIKQDKNNNQKADTGDISVLSIMIIPGDTIPSSINDSPDMLQKSTEKTSENDAAEQSEDEIFRMVEEPPSFPGGQKALFKFIDDNLKYPKKAPRVAGRIILLFVIRKDGSVEDIKVLQSLSPLVDEEAVRVIQSMPKWIPGKQNGKPVSVYYSIPIRFN